MEELSRSEVWRELYVMLGTTAGALIGLLFIATSLHLDEIVNNPAYRSRARFNTIYLMTLVVEAALVLAPQPGRALGFELTATAVCLLVLHLKNIYRFYFRNKTLGKSGGFSIVNASRFVASQFLGSAGGVLLIAGSRWGLYCVTAGYLLFLFSIVMNAWAIMVWVGQTQSTVKQR